MKNWIQTIVGIIIGAILIPFFGVLSFKLANVFMDWMRI